MILDAALHKGLEWNDLKAIMNIQSYDLGEQNEVTRLYPFMQAATGDGMKLETLYHFAMYDPSLIYNIVKTQ